MRRRRNDIAEDLVEALSHLFTVVHPLWCIPLAAGLFFAVRAWFNHGVGIPGLEPLGNMVGGLSAVMVLAGGLAGWRLRFKRREFLRPRLDIDWLNALSWREFEQQVGEVYRDQGFWVDQLGGRGPDGGVDLRLKKDGFVTLVQCKRWKIYKVGVQPVRELFGVMAAEKADRAVFITSGIYTQEALRFAEGKPIDLVDGAQLAEMLRRFQDSLRRQSRTGTTPISAPEPDDIPVRPVCPRCGSEMVLRRAKHGVNAGKEFWGCSMYPKCRGIRDVK